MSEHKLVGDTLVNVGRGIVARCTCGWTSGPRFSSMIASALFRDHLLDNATASEVLRGVTHDRG